MELSDDNLEELAIAMSDNTTSIGGINGHVYQNKTNFSNLDVDRVISEAQECLLSSSIEPIRSCSPACSFSDILDDICEMNKTMELEKAASNTASVQIPAYSPMTDMPMASPNFFHMPDISIQQGDYNGFSNQSDYLVPLDQWPEYLSSPSTALNIMQEIPQLTTVPTPPPPPPPSPKLQENSSDAPTIIVSPNQGEPQVVATTPVAPMQLHTNFHFNFSPSMAHAPYVQSGDGSQAAGQLYTSPIENNINFVMVSEPTTDAPPKKRSRIEMQPPTFDWARVVPRQTFVQPSEVMILRPLRTRKLPSTRPCIDLSTYFDTSAISIPMIRERPRYKNTDRRKQKLYTIPGADNLFFEVQMQAQAVEEEHLRQETNQDTDLNNNADQLYPETEIPELDEIFKRKRRGFSSRRNIQQHQDQIKTPTPFQEIREETLAETSPEQPTVQLDSNSDLDSDDAPLTIVKSMKCQNCKKIFKTCRSLTIHSKRCNVIQQSPEREKPPDTAQSRTSRKISIQSCSSKENVDVKKDSDKPPLGQKVFSRPITRSQTNTTKRKATESEGGGPSKKRF